MLEGVRYLCYFVLVTIDSNIYCKMNRLISTIFLAMALLMPMAVGAREDELAELLEQCLLREANSPDSIEYNLQYLERVREGKSGTARAVYSAALGQLYAKRA